MPQAETGHIKAAWKSIYSLESEYLLSPPISGECSQNISRLSSCPIGNRRSIKAMGPCKTSHIDEGTAVQLRIADSLIAD